MLPGSSETLLAKFAPAPPVADAPALPARPDAAHFAAPHCHNCGAQLATPCCGECGQPRAERLGSRHVGADFWDEWAPFGADVLGSAWRLLRAPGTVAREYVLGARRRHVNPFKLLLVAVAVLLLVLERSRYLAARDNPVGEAMALVQGWANLSFSLGLLAFLAASLLCFRRRGGYNLVEHLVLACYAQFVVVAVSILSKLPLLVAQDAGFLAAHKQASAWLLDGVGVLVLLLACRQFFLLDLRRDRLRLLAAAAVFLLVKWLLLRAYAFALLQIVLARPG